MLSSYLVSLRVSSPFVQIFSPSFKIYMARQSKKTCCKAREGLIQNYNPPSNTCCLATRHPLEVHSHILIILKTCCTNHLSFLKLALNWTVVQFGNYFEELREFKAFPIPKLACIKLLPVITVQHDPVPHRHGLLQMGLVIQNLVSNRK